MYETICSPIDYGGLELKNRIIFAPTTFGMQEDEYLAKIKRIAEGRMRDDYCRRCARSARAILKNPYSTRRDLNIIKGFVKLRMRRIAKSARSFINPIPIWLP